MADLRDKIFFLINPRSGGRLAAALIRSLKQLEEAADSRLIVEELNPDTLHAQIERGTRGSTFVIGGGDGTVSRVIALLGDSPVKVGVLPLGTGNDLARELKMPRDLPKAGAAQICAFFHGAESRNLTVSSLQSTTDPVEKHLFINYLSFGFDAAVIHTFDQWRQSPGWRAIRGVWMNRMGYTASALRHLMTRVSAEVRQLPNGEPRAINGSASILFANIRSVMGLAQLNHVGSAFDDKIECMIVPTPFNYIPMLTRQREPRFGPVLVGSGAEWELSALSTGARIQIDGEPIGVARSANYRIRSIGHANVLVGPEFR